MAFLQDIWDRAVALSAELFWVSLVALAIALLVKRGQAVEDGLRSWREIRLNLIYQAVDLVAIIPLAVLLVEAISTGVQTLGIALVGSEVYAEWPGWLVLLLCLLISDFTGYWRHRLLHTSVLWPVHAIHHSDREMTFTTLMRFHPINRMVTVGLNALVLAIMGMPTGAIALNSLIRHYYGYYVHAHLPWSYGPLKRIFVSPVMHRWHHVREVEGSGANFATIFAFYDWVFGTHYMPNRPVPDLGVDDRGFPDSWLGQQIFPFRVWLGLIPPEEEPRPR